MKASALFLQFDQRNGSSCLHDSYQGFSQGLQCLDPGLRARLPNSSEYDPLLTVIQCVASMSEAGMQMGASMAQVSCALCMTRLI